LASDWLPIGFEANDAPVYFRLRWISKIVVIPIFERLERNGIVQQASDAKRDQVYCAQALLDILEEPALLTPLNAESC
jgi:hypothetical protein